MRALASVIPLALLTLCVHAKTPLPDSAIESVRVHEVVEQMHSAINRSDLGAYMALIDPDDPVFLTEQRAWIADLDAHPVKDIKLTVRSDQPVRLLDDATAVAPIEITWRIPGEDRDRRCAYDALFRPVGAVSGQWVFAGRDWDIHLLDTPGVRIYADAGHEHLAKLAQARVPVLRDAIAADLGRDLSQGNLSEIVVKIYPDMNALQASIYLAYNDPLAGWNEPGESIKILARDTLEQSRLDPLLAHEIGHAVSFEFGPDINTAPWWTLEGIAEVAAGLFRDSWDRQNKRITAWARKDDLRDWSLLADFRGEANNHGRWVYLQGWSMIDYIGRTFGTDARNAWFEQLAHDHTLDEASRATLKISFDQLDTQWRQSLLDRDTQEADPDEGDSGS